MDDRKFFISKIGNFFLLIGIGMIFLFVASDMGKQPNFWFLLAAVLALVAAWNFKRISAPPPPPPSKRFEWLRKWRQKMKDDQAKREAAKKAKAEKKK